jgi:hypothetical protein
VDVIRFIVAPQWSGVVFIRSLSVLELGKPDTVSVDAVRVTQR